MNKNSLLGLIAVAAILGGLAYMKSNKGGTSRSANAKLAGEKLLPDLTTEVANSITEIEFQSADQTTTLKKSGDNWVASSLHNYPVDFKQVKGFITAVFDQKIGQTQSANEAQRRELQLMDPTTASEADKGDAGTKVTLKAGEKVVGSFIIGTGLKAASQGPSGFGGMGGGRGQYIQTANGDVVLISGSFSQAGRKSLDWATTELLRLPQAQVTSVTVSGPDRQKVELAKDKESGKVTLADLPKGKEAVESEINGLVNALSYLSIAGVADPKLSDADLGFDKAISYVSSANNGLTYTVLVGGKASESDGRLIRIKCDYKPATQAPEKPAEDADEAKKTAYQNQLARIKEEQERLSKQAADFNAKHGPWTYTIATFKADSLLKKHNTLFKDPEPEEPGAENSPALPAPKPAP